MGLGRFGGGVGVTRFLAGLGCDVVVTDLADESDLAEPLGAIGDLIDAGTVELRLGGHNVSDFTTCDVVVANPAVPRPWENRFLRAAEAASIPVTTEVRLGLERLDPAGFGGPDTGRVVIGVTGTAGKSTTSAMMGHGLERLGRARVRGAVAGNIGRSLLDPALLEADAVVVEVSSAQLHWLGAGVGYADAPAWSCATAVVTGFGPNHVDWHGDLAHYEASKRSLVRGAVARDGGVVLGPGVAHWGEIIDDGRSIETVSEPCRASAIDVGCRVVVGDGVIDSMQGVRAIGRHNRANACVAAAGLASAGVAPSFQEAFDAVRGFGGLEHRLCAVGEWTGDRVGAVRVIDDSKCTTPEGIALALASLEDPAAAVVVVGGYDKGVDLSGVFGELAGCAGVLCVGATGGVFAAGVEAAGGTALEIGGIDRLAAGLDQLVEAGRLPGVSGAWSLVLSPGCASWDQFPNYEARGAAFLEAAPRWLGANNAQKIGDGG